MSEKRTTTSESRKTSREKRAEAKKRLDSQRRSGDNITRVMTEVSKLRSTGFADTDQKVMRGADKIGQSAESVGTKDLKVTSASADALTAHGKAMEHVAKRAASEGRKADQIRSADSRLADTRELRAGYKESEAVASDLSRGDKQTATATNMDAKTISARVKADSRKRPVFN